MYQAYPGRTRPIVYSGLKTVTTAGTQVVLAAAQTVTQVTVQCLSTNTGSIWVGDADVSDTTGLELNQGESVTFPVGNLADVWIDSSNNGDKATFLAT